MTHRNAPLTVEGRQRAVDQVVQYNRPISHVAAQFHIAGSTLSKWVGRYRQFGADGLEDRSSVPHQVPNRLPAHVVALIEQWRREHNGQHPASPMNCLTNTTSTAANAP